MRRGLLALCLLFLLPLPAFAGKPRATLRAHAEANAQDGAAFSTKMRSAVSGREIVIEKIPTISELDVVAFRPYEAPNGTYGALFLLNDHGKLALDTLSVEKRGRFLYIFVNGKPVAELLIDCRVSDGKLFVASGLGVDDLALLRKKWPIIGTRKK